MERPNDASVKYHKHMQKRRRAQWMIASTWVTAFASFAGFFAIWNHLSTTSATASTTQRQTTRGTFTYSDSGRHHRDDGFGGGSGSSFGGGSAGSYGSGNGYSGGSGFGASGGTQVNPGSSSGQFVSRAS